jgi:hypothetical protein
MANVKIPQLSPLTPPAASDLALIWDVSADAARKSTVGEIVGIINGDVEVASNGTATISELPVSKLQDGAARQLLQTDAAGTGVEWTSNVDIPGTLDVTGTATFDEHINLASSKQYRIAGAKVLDATSLGTTVVSSSLTSVGTIDTGVWQGTAIDAAYLDSTVVTTNDTGTVTSTMLADGTIVDADINAAAAIAGTKISPDFGSQNIATTGDLDIDTGLLKAIAGTNSIGLFGATPATQPAAIANITTTATTGSLPTADGTVTIADAAAPTVTELLEYCVELEAKLEAALAALRTLGVIAS